MVWCGVWRGRAGGGRGAHKPTTRYTGPRGRKGDRDRRSRLKSCHHPLRGAVAGRGVESGGNAKLGVEKHRACGGISTPPEPAKRGGTPRGASDICIPPPPLEAWGGAAIRNHDKTGAEACVRRAMVGRLGMVQALGFTPVGWRWRAHLLRRLLGARSSRILQHDVIRGKTVTRARPGNAYCILDSRTGHG